MAALSAPPSLEDEQFVERQRLFEDFLASERTYGEHQQRDYKERIRGLLKHHGRRLLINLNDLRQANPTMATGLLQRPTEWLPPLQAALKEVASSLNDPTFEYDLTGVKLHVGFEGSFGALHTTPRHLSSRLLGHMVCLDGIVTSCSLVRPKLLRSVHYSQATRSFKAREYWDATMLVGGSLAPSSASSAATSMNYPTTGGAEDPTLISEFGLSTYRDYQTVAMQEMPERAPAGQLPRAVDVILDDDLVDGVKPGDRVQIVGVYKSLATANGAVIPAHFRAAVVALAVRPLAGTGNGESHLGQQQSSLSLDDQHNIKALARRRDIFELLSRSLAPSIYGHDWVKRAILLMLLGGVEKNLPNGTHLRGDINLMLVGDPSTAKSQMLRFVLALAPLAIATTGRGSSGVGLTAAVTTDRETGERRLEAGAMVLADRGIVCIDEFDKMSDVDRVAIHEVMEQQTVTIAKAGIHASLNARCAVLAAANPIWGQYRETASPQENIRLPDSLLSRFDLLFIILDTAEPAHDHRISSHVLRMHRYIPPGLTEGQPISEHLFDAIEDEDDDASDVEGTGHGMGTAVDRATTVFQKHYARVSGRSHRSDGANTVVANGDDGDTDDNENDDDGEIVTLAFLKKYIQYARTRIQPVLTKAASEHIVTAYAEFRQKRDAAISATGATEAKTFPVTPRTLETLIRLATAHAKARLSSRVERRDARVAQELIEYCLYKEVKKKPSKRRRRAAESSANEGEDESDDESERGSDNEGGGENENDEGVGEVNLNLDKAGHGSRGERSRRSTTARQMEGLSLEESSSRLSPPPAPPYSLASGPVTAPAATHVGLGAFPSSLPTPFVTVDSQLEDSLRFVDASQDTGTSGQASQAPTTSIVTINETVRKLVRGALNQLRSQSTSAVFTTTVDELLHHVTKDERERQQSGSVINKESILAVLEEMQVHNQVMLSDGNVYII